MALRENLKALRKKKKLSQRKLSEISGVSYSMVCKLESGEQNNPSLETVEKIASALGVSSGELLRNSFSSKSDITDTRILELIADNSELFEMIAKAEKDGELSLTVHYWFRKFITSKEATEFFSINHDAISPDELEDLEERIFDYIRYQFSKYIGKESIYDN